MGSVDVEDWVVGGRVLRLQYSRVGAWILGSHSDKRMRTFTNVEDQHVARSIFELSFFLPVEQSNSQGSLD